VLFRDGVTLHVLIQLLETCFPRLVHWSPGIEGKEAREQMAARASLGLFTPRGTWSG
jgi:hypothetical protein